MFAHYVTPALPFVFLLFAAGARAAFAHRRLKMAMLALAAIVCAGGIESTLAILAADRRPERPGRSPGGGAAACWTIARPPSRPVDACPARLDFGFIGMTYTYGIFARTALQTPIRWELTPSSFVYRLQKRADPPPLAAGAFPMTAIGPVNLYRLR